jgi:predicted negative regulator of RcsB-dependent stress response
MNGRVHQLMLNGTDQTADKAPLEQPRHPLAKAEGGAIGSFATAVDQTIPARLAQRLADVMIARQNAPDQALKDLRVDPSAKTVKMVQNDALSRFVSFLR